MIFEVKKSEPIGDLESAVLPDELVSYFENNLHRYEQKLKEVTALNLHTKNVTNNKIVLSSRSLLKH